VCVARNPTLRCAGVVWAPKPQQCRMDVAQTWPRLVALGEAVQVGGGNRRLVGGHRRGVRRASLLVEACLPRPTTTGSAGPTWLREPEEAVA
jgi:hypothetical protein